MAEPLVSSGARAIPNIVGKQQKNRGFLRVMPHSQSNFELKTHVENSGGVTAVSWLCWQSDSTTRRKM